MATCSFRSPLAFRLQCFLEARPAAKRPPTFKILCCLDRFLMGAVKPGDTITRQAAEGWFKSMEHLAPGTRINRMSVLRQFCRYLSHFDPRTCIVHRMFLPRRNRPMPHIYTRQEVCRIMTAGKAVRSRDALRPAVFATIVGFLYATGLRVGEAVKLNLADVELKRALILIRQTKFQKTRYVPLAPSTVEHLAFYLRQRRNAGFSQEPTAPFFPAASGGRYHVPTFTTTFLQILRRLGLRGPSGQRGPRIHDLRHSFAVSRLLAWHRAGDNLFAKLPTLSTYLGHSTVTGTEVYLHATVELMESTGQRFHDHFAVPAASRLCHPPTSHR
ncbi:MAG: tyrosine-type recombinase/integrase [Verrucomicrobia bacterium]|nr:tyrosine-type recombinase/integrase [Verrucomicrobiota bacterium]